MVQVLEFNPIADDPASEQPTHGRIRQASKLLAALFGIILLANVALVAFLASAFLVPYAGDHLTIGPKGLMLNFGPAPHGFAWPAGYVAVSGLPTVQRLSYLAIGLVVGPPSLMIFWNLRQLFRLYGQGVVFSEANARRIKHVGLWLAASAISPLVAFSVMSALHMAIDRNWVHDDTIAQALLGGIVYVIGMVMQVGHEIEEERGQFV